MKLECNDRVIIFGLIAIALIGILVGGWLIAKGLPGGEIVTIGSVCVGGLVGVLTGTKRE